MTIGDNGRLFLETLVFRDENENRNGFKVLTLFSLSVSTYAASFVLLNINVASNNKEVPHLWP